MWIWPLIALSAYSLGIQATTTPTKLACIAIATAAYCYWDWSRTCKHCKRKAH